MQNPTRHSFNLDKLHSNCCKYFYAGYHIYFIHGWFCAYLSAVTENDDDLLIPTYLVLDEDLVLDEKPFISFIDELLILYKHLATTTFEYNKLIKPLISLNSSNSLDNIANVTDPATKHLIYSNTLNWLYGYLANFLSNDDKISADIESKYQELLDTKYYQSLYTLCCAALALDEYVYHKDETVALLINHHINYTNDYNETKQDIIDLWENNENGNSIIKQAQSMAIDELIQQIVPAINNIFYVMRVIDEYKLTNT